MILWSIHGEEAVRQLERRGVLRGDGRRIYLWEHRFAFHWMIRQMTERLGPPPRGSRYPVWAWSAYNGQRAPRPDLRCRAHLPRGTKGARIEIDVPEERVLLSDFDRWHLVLYGVYLCDDEEDDRRFEAGPYDRASVQQSWQRIFELGRGDPACYGPPSARSIQATLWSIRLDDVRDITWFTAR